MDYDDDCIVPLDELKMLLKIKDVEYDDGDDYLGALLKYKIGELAGLIGVDLLPVDREYFIHKFKSNKIFLNFYPVYSIDEITIGKKDLDDEYYNLNKMIGVIYLDKIYTGSVNVNYTTRLSDKELVYTIKPLLMDMVMYAILNKGKGINEGVMSSIHEGDVSVSYDTGSSLGNRIYTRINDLKLKYSNYNAKARLL